MPSYPLPPGPLAPFGGPGCCGPGVRGQGFKNEFLWEALAPGSSCFFDSIWKRKPTF